MVSYQGAISLASICVYVPTLYISTLLAIRHGFGSNAVWIFLILFSLVRITGESLQLAATEFFPPASAPNTSLDSGAAIMTEIGLTPLLMSSVSLLSRLYTPKGRRMAWVLSFMGIPVLISLILIVAGGIDPTSRDGPTFSANGEIQAAMAIYCGCYLLLVWCVLVLFTRILKADRDEIKILFTVAFSLPMLAVVVAYTMAYAFESIHGDQRFNVISGSNTLQLFLAMNLDPQETSAAALFENITLVPLLVTASFRPEESKHLPT
ncbi:hypothetical protein K402DRAFT_444093 [Aulographum hederae CBS 113979]|uniref:DUF7702 domain-containing protein n=1 Tax=Aulographum hederae CBS 113979 TaxID=1176131 RepID=A0A6G1HCA9_9PEZI|nr:hypothetical protein K402DRAFT_444093 [Aulographum hederae CBS 113979]